MAEEGKKNGKSNLSMIIVVAVIVLAVAGIIIFTVISSKTGIGLFTRNIKEEVVTADNYDSLLDRIEKELKNEDEVCYLTYAMMYNMMNDSFSASLSENADDESIIYANIYGKTIQALIDEGKRLMSDNGVSIDDFKENIKDASDELN